MIQTPTHLFFYSKTVFGNWHVTRYFDEVAQAWFNNAEAGFMYYKAKVFGDEETANKILFAKTAREAKELGRAVKQYNEILWQSVRYGYMKYVLRLKFSQNPAARKELLDTKDLILVEASPTDCIWGIGLGEDNALIFNETNWRGENLLGKCLMDVRKLMVRLEEINTFGVEQPGSSFGS